MVLECYKSLSFGHTFCPVGNVQISGDVFGFVVNSVDCVSVGFLVGRCDAVHALPEIRDKMAVARAH